MDARIGKLVREGKEIFYAFVGEARKYVEGTLKDVEIALGLRKKALVFRNYVVTVTPKFESHSGSWFAREYTVEYVAKDRADALRQARADYEDGSINPAVFRAKLA